MKALRSDRSRSDFKNRTDALLWLKSLVTLDDGITDRDWNEERLISMYGSVRLRRGLASN